MKKKNDNSAWVWMPHPAHLIVGQDCRFHLATYLGNGYLVSTVGEWLPDSSSWDIYAESAGVVLQGIGDERRADFMRKVGFVDIGYNRKYETLVFKSGPKKDSSCGCAFSPTSWGELDSGVYNDAREATDGHMALCRKYSAKSK